MGAKADTETADRQELAEERTERAHRRTLLAKERTFSAWLRTGLATVATGFAAAKLLTDVWPTWLVPVLSSLLVVTGGLIFAIGYWSYLKTFRALEREGVQGIPSWIIGTITAFLVVGSIVGLVLVL